MLGSSAVADQPPCRGIVHLWNLDAPPPDGLRRGRARGRPGGRAAQRRLARAGLGPRRPRPVRAAVPGDPRRPVGRRPARAGRRSPRLPRSGWGGSSPASTPGCAASWWTSTPRPIDGGVGRSSRSSSPTDDEDEVAWRGAERYVHRYLPAPGLPPEGERGPTQAGVPYRLAIAAARDARRPGPPDAAAAAAGSGRGRDRGRRRRPQLQRRDEGAGDVPRPARRPRAARRRVQRPDHGRRRGRRRACTSATRCWRSPASPSAATS